MPKFLPPNERRSRQVTTMLTPPEENDVARIQRELGTDMSVSSTIRYLVLKGIAAHDSQGGIDG